MACRCCCRSRPACPFDRLPEWAELRALPLDAQAELLRRPEVRERLVRAANEGDFGRAVGAEARKPRYDRIHVLERAHGRNPTLAELSESSGRDPVEIMIDLALESKFEVFFQQFPVKPDNTAIEAMLKHPRTAMTFSDSGAHVSQIMDSSIQTDLLAEWVRAREVFTLEEAVRMITYVPATLWGMADRGLVREGMAADLNVIDPDTIAPQLPELAADLPAGARRLVQKAQGISATIVGGRTGAHRRRPDRRAAGPPAARPPRPPISRRRDDPSTGVEPGPPRASNEVEAFGVAAEHRHLGGCRQAERPHSGDALANPERRVRRVAAEQEPVGAGGDVLGGEIDRARADGREVGVDARVGVEHGERLVGGLVAAVSEDDRCVGVGGRNPVEGGQLAASVRPLTAWPRWTTTGSRRSAANANTASSRASSTSNAPTEQCSLRTPSPSRSTASSTMPRGRHRRGGRCRHPCTGSGPRLAVAASSADASLSPTAMPGLWA